MGWISLLMWDSICLREAIFGQSTAVQLRGDADNYASGWKILNNPFHQPLSENIRSLRTAPGNRPRLPHLHTMSNLINISPENISIPSRV